MNVAIMLVGPNPGMPKVPPRVTEIELFKISCPVVAAPQVAPSLAGHWAAWANLPGLTMSTPSIARLSRTRGLYTGLTPLKVPGIGFDS